MRSKTYGWRRGGDAETAIWGVVTGLVLLITLAPILVIFILSFGQGSTLEFPPENWGLRWYGQAFDFLWGPSAHIERLGESLLTSFYIASIVTIVSVLAGVPAAFALVRFRFPGKLMFEQLVSLPLIFPVIVLGIALLIIVSQFRLEFGFWRIAVGHVIIVSPFVIRNCMASLRGVNRSFEEAARTLGAGPARAFQEVLLPLIQPGIFAGMLLAFIISFNEFTLSFFLFTPSAQPFPIWLFQRASTSLDPTIFSLTSIMFAFNFLLIWLLGRILGDKSFSV
jgi:putative spermidine/putrescine transport system permease protein